MIDERQSPRYPVSWPVRLWLSPDCALLGRVVEASVQELKVGLLTWVPGDVFRMGESYRLDIDHPRAGELVRVADMRNASLSGLGFDLHEPLPDGLLGEPAPDDRLAGATAGPAGRTESRRAMLVLQQLAALIRSWLPLMSEVGQTSIGGALESLVLDAFAEGALGEWDALGHTFDQIERLTRMAVRMEELPIAQFVTIQTVLRAAQASIRPLGRQPATVMP